MTVYEYLGIAQDKIRDPANHTQKCFARDELSVPCDPTGERACCWCASGVMKWVFSNLKPDYNLHEAAFNRLYDAAEELFGITTGLVGVNDDHGHAAVMQVFDRARQNEFENKETKVQAMGAYDK